MYPIFFLHDLKDYICRSRERGLSQLGFHLRTVGAVLMGTTSKSEEPVIYVMGRKLPRENLSQS